MGYSPWGRRESDTTELLNKTTVKVPLGVLTGKAPDTGQGASQNLRNS